MGISIQVKGIKKLEKDLKKMSPKNYRQEIAKAINRAGDKAYSSQGSHKGALQIMQSRLSRSPSYIKRSIKRGRRATPARLQMYAVQVKKRQRPGLIEFGATAQQNGFTYEIEPGNRKTIRDAFVAESRGRGRQVFRRAGRSRLPIIRLKGVSVWGVAVKGNAQADFRKSANFHLNYEINKTMKRLTK